MDFDVESTSTLSKALGLLAQWPWELIILDLILPDGNGIEVLKVIREQKSKIAVAVISGAGNEMLAQTLQLRPQGLFGKPIDIDDFRGWLSGLVERLLPQLPNEEPLKTGIKPQIAHRNAVRGQALEP